MKIILLHGDHSGKSRDRLNRFIDVAHGRDWEVVRINPRRNELKEKLTSSSLFKKSFLFLIDDFNSLSTVDLSWIKKNKNKFEGNLVVFHNKTLGKRAIGSLGKVDKIEEFKLPVLIFKFLESFYPGNSQNTLHLLHRVLEKEPVELVFAFLARVLKDLYIAKVEPKALDYPGWRRAKLATQSQKFTKEELEYIIDELSKIDVLSKTTDENLSDLLDFLIISKLE